MKQTASGKIDTQGLQKAITTLAVAAGLAGWAVLARPEVPVTATTAAASIAQAAPAAQVAPVAQAAPATQAAPMAQAAPLRVVTAPAPVTATRSSR